MIGLHRRAIFGLIVAALVVPRVARAQDSAAVQQPIHKLYNALDEVMAKGKETPFPARFDVLAPVIDEVYDLDTVLRVSVGARWGSLDQASKDALFKAFRNFTIATYVANFDSDDGDKFEIQPGLRVAGADEIVSSQIIPARGGPTTIDYVMHDNNGWRIVDVLLDGTISRVAVQRSDFRSLLSSGDAKALINSLERKTSDLSGGSLRS